MGNLCTLIEVVTLDRVEISDIAKQPTKLNTAQTGYKFRGQIPN
jgi:hypothetical protein